MISERFVTEIRRGPRRGSVPRGFTFFYVHYYYFIITSRAMSIPLCEAYYYATFIMLIMHSSGRRKTA